MEGRGQRVKDLFPLFFIYFEKTLLNTCKFKTSALYLYQQRTTHNNKTYKS